MASLGDAMLNTDPDLERCSFADVLKDRPEVLARWAKRLALIHLTPDRAFVTELPMAERNAYQRTRFTTKTQKKGPPVIEMDLANTESKLLVRAVVDESGQRLFAEKDAATLAQKIGAQMLDPLYTAALRLSDLDQKARDIEKDFFGEIQIGESPSASGLSAANGTSSG